MEREILAGKVENDSGELRLTSLRGRGVYAWPAFALLDNDGVVGRGSPDAGDWVDKGDVGIVKDGLGIVEDGLGVPPMDGRGDPTGIAVFACRSTSDCLGVDVGEALLNLTSPGGTPSVELLDTEDVFE